jgi:hypothetical protein
MGYNYLMDPSPFDTNEQPRGKEGTLGPLSATIVIVLILLIAGVYFLVQQERHLRTLRVEQQAQLPA